jgi:outer membrane lipoprotein
MTRMKTTTVSMVLTLALALTGCATRPPLDLTGARLDLAPYAVAEANPGAGDSVVWGGMIIEVNNHPDSSDIVVLAYPLDKSLRPVLKAPTIGRFVLQMPGYIERFDWPQGRFLTARGTIKGTREGLIDEKRYVYPVITLQDVHLWRAGFQDTGPHFSFGVGVGIR